MIMYLVLIVLNLWYRRQKRMESNTIDQTKPMKDGENSADPMYKINVNFEEDSEEKDEL